MRLAGPMRRAGIKMPGSYVMEIVNGLVIDFEASLDAKNFS